MTRLIRHMFLAIVLGPAVLVSTGAQGHGVKQTQGLRAPRDAAAPERKPFGQPGDPKAVTRTLNVEMNDAMRFTPARLEVRQDETVRFIVKNTGRTMHEMVLGTMAGLKAHHDLMKKHPGMEHDEPYMVHVAPGRSESIFWQFTRLGEFYYGCLIPGHFEAGMIGRVVVK